jgi:hypothetical protein
MVLKRVIAKTTRQTILVTTEEGAEEHCQSSAPAISNQRIFDWLDDTFANTGNNVVNECIHV